MPIGRSDGKTVVIFADGHIETQLPSALDDMRLWVDVATDKDFKYDFQP